MNYKKNKEVECCQYNHFLPYSMELYDLVLILYQVHIFDKMDTYSHIRFLILSILGMYGYLQHILPLPFFYNFADKL